MPPKGQITSAFSGYLNEITLLAKKNWEADDPSSLDGTALNHLRDAYAIDLAGALLRFPPGTAAEVLKAVEANKQHLETPAGKRWVDDIQPNEEIALCRTLKTYSDGAR